MSIYTILSGKVDARNGGTDCKFNGYLEDYLSFEENIDEFEREVFEDIVEEHSDARIIVDYRTTISEEAISNQIIRYKDIFKLNGKPLHLPYMIYGEEDGKGRALLMVPYDTYSGIYAKAMYYCISEPGSDFIEAKNEIVSISSDDSEEIVDAYDRMFIEKAGSIQRRLDQKSYTSYRELFSKAMEAGDQLCQQCFGELIQLQDRTDAIYSYVVRWFMLKKILYVQYMVDRNLLKNTHGGDVKAQRNQAKKNAMAINIKGFSEMWRVTEESSQKAE